MKISWTSWTLFLGCVYQYHSWCKFSHNWILLSRFLHPQFRLLEYRHVKNLSKSLFSCFYEGFKSNLKFYEHFEGERTLTAKATIQCYRKYHILIQEFRNCLGNNIELMKSSFRLCNVIINYVLVLWNHKFNVLTTPILICSFIVQTNPPLLLQSHFWSLRQYLAHPAYPAQTEGSNSLRDQVYSIVSTGFVPTKTPKNQSCRPYFLDRPMVAVFFHIVISYTLSLLIFMQSRNTHCGSLHWTTMSIWTHISNYVYSRWIKTHPRRPEKATAYISKNMLDLWGNNISR